MTPETQTSPQDGRETIPASRGAPAKRKDYARLLRLIDEWLADESGYDEETWPALKEALEANRAGGRRLFSD